MSYQPIAHGKFSIERIYTASRDRVFTAWADPAIKARWFVGPQDWTLIARELDFRVGGRELLRGRFAARETLFTATFHSILAGERIVFTYDMHVGDRHHSVSLAAAEFLASGQETRMIFTEQIAFLDGTDGTEGTASRQVGTAAHFDRLALQLDPPSLAAARH
jgi:uncharacterized protein YndB with AHSA1/START domain